LGAQALRRLSTRQLRAERDRLDRERAGCPPDRAAAARRAAERAAADEQARRDAEATRDAARKRVAALTGLRGVTRPRLAAAARLELVDTERELAQATRAAASSAGRADALRRATQQRRAWLEAHDAPLQAQERAVARELAWRRRADAAALVAARPGWLEAALGPLPDHQEGQAAWREAAVALDGYRRLWGLADTGPAQHAGGRTERAAAAAAAGGPRRMRPGAALLGPEPRRDLGQRRDWKAARIALERLDRAKDEREERQGRTRRAARDRDDERAIS
jgi:hypothetical protein